MFRGKFSAEPWTIRGADIRIKDMIRAREQLLVDVSHELRSPLSRLKLAVQFVSEADTKARTAADLAALDIMMGELLELERRASYPMRERQL
jgi:signal transduction histidine kinase